MKNRSTFLDEIALGRYIKGDSALHRASPTWKALLFSSVAIATFWLESAASFLILGTVVALLSLLAKLPQRLFWRSLRPVNLLAMFTILAGAFFNHQAAPYFSWEGLHSGGLYAARLVFITLLTTLYFLTTQPNQAIELGIRVLRPLRLLGISQEELSLLVHLAYRFVPLLGREIKELRLGQQARNLPVERSPWRKLKAVLDNLVFIFIGALHRAEITGLALEQRRVLDGWTSSTPTAPRGTGGWPCLLLLLSLILVYWKDSALL